MDDRIESGFYRGKKPVPPEVAEFMRRFEFEKGIDYLDRLLEKDPDFEDAWVKKGMCYQLAQKYEEAIEAYDRALKLNPANSAAKEGKERSANELK